MTNRYSPEMAAVLEFSKEEALRLKNSAITPLHLLLAILRTDNSARKILLKEVSSIDRLKLQLEEHCNTAGTIGTTAGQITMNDETTRVLRLCVLEARQLRSSTIDTPHLLLAILEVEDSEANSILQRFGADYKHIARHIYPDELMQRVFGNGERGKKDFKYGEEYDEDMDEDDDDDLSNYEHAGFQDGQDGFTKQSAGGSTPALDNFATDLTKAASESLLDPVIGRDKEILRVAQILSRRKKNNPLLIGEPGVGKSAIVEGLAQRIVSHRISRTLWNKRVMMLDLAALVAGTKYRGQFEERIRSILQELKRNPDIIIFIDEVHNMVGAGNASGSMDAANLLKPALARGEIQCIGSTTLSECHKSIEKDGALDRRFQKVMVEPTSPQETHIILQQLQKRYEEHHNVTYTPEALEACVRLTERYVTDRQFPDKAIDALDEAGSYVHVQEPPRSEAILKVERELEKAIEQKNEAARNADYELASSMQHKQTVLEKKLDRMNRKWENEQSQTANVVDDQLVAEVVSRMTGIPVQRIDSDENARLRILADTLRQHIIGQDEAVTTLAKAIQRGRVGLKDPHRPIGTFMFVGPTGVGKTYLTKLLAEELFGSRDNIIRIDMSEYMEKHTVSRIIGAPPGYVGHEDGGQLTERVRRKPYSIVLLDEIEKAHSDVFNILLQVMDEGRLTDGNGVTVDFRNTVIIMTSNCGTRQVKEFGQGIGFPTPGSDTGSKSKNHDILKKALYRQFTPEFLNRLDDIIYFDQLSRQSMERIVDIELKPLEERVEEMGYHLEVSSQAKALICEKGYDIQFGARPLKRAIQSMIEDRICECILSGDLVQGTTMEATVEDGQVTVKPKFTEISVNLQLEKEKTITIEQ